MSCRNFIISMISMILVLMALTGCFANPAGSDMTEASRARPTEQGTANLPTDPLQQAPSGVLRLWWTRRTTLNPLLDMSDSGIAANRLVFQGLFQIGADQRLQKALADEISFDDAYSSSIIKLKTDRVFHDGSPVTATDVEACINFMMTNSGKSAYSAGLSSISSVQVLDEHTLKLTLSYPDYWLAYRLTFPVIPAVSLKAKPFELIPGTGDYRMESYDSKQGLTLIRADGLTDHSILQSIRLFEFDDLQDAMKAFADDRIDLVILPPADYARYVLRNSLRFGQYYSQEAIILAYNTRQKHLLNDPKRLIWLRRLLAISNLNLSAVPGISNGTAVPADSYFLDGTDFSEDQALAGLGEGAWAAAKDPLTVLVPAKDSQIRQVAAVIGDQLARAGVNWIMRVEDTDGFTAALEAGEFDLVIQNVVLPDEPDPAWLYINRQALPPSLQDLAGNGLPGNDHWLLRLQASAKLASMRDKPDTRVLRENLFETAVRSPLSVLLIRSAAIVYGDRVIGQSEPNRYNPYKGIEELWIWSGQSS